MGKIREESATIPQATEFIRFAKISTKENTALASKLGVCGTISKKCHDVHINAYHVTESCIREGAGPHLRMPASTRPRRRRHHLGHQFHQR
jgi:hypothetical protein